MPVATRTDGYRFPMGFKSLNHQKKKVNLIIKWAIIFSSILQIVFFLCIFFWDYYAGQATLGFGIEGETYMGIGMFYIYTVSLFLSLIVISAIYKADQNFGMGVLVFVPYAIIGFFVEYYFEIDVLKGIWAVIGWCLIGLMVGFSADVSFKVLKEHSGIREEYVAGLTGVVMNLVYFLLVCIAIETFYLSNNGLSGPGSFFGVAYFGLPWMLIHGFFGGYLAYAMNHQIEGIKKK
ncbi:MAG: hypothetical protein JSV04_11080 [Candidatus Heimdallarchaeota archaeon]|nr:MAG: hypothetical protein JSV04_11080 [Candidatus Heimdallarchaeota archaeon]